MFDVNKYRQLLTTMWIGQSLKYFEKLPSTSTFVKKLPAEKASHGLVCLADNQTKGRGQYERNWESETGKNLTFTLAFKPSEANRFHILTLACARAAVDQIIESTGVEAYIKWPNDIIAEGRKIGGLLTETTFNGNHLDRLMVGVGINVNQERFSEELRGKATSLSLLSGKTLDREQFLCSYLARVEYEYGRWHKKNNDLLRSINQRILGYGKWIRLNVNGKERRHKSKLLGVNEEGQLTVIDEEGGIETFSYEQIRLITD